MVSLGDYELIFAGRTVPEQAVRHSSRSTEVESSGSAPFQYVFADRDDGGDEEPLLSALRRVETFPDLMKSVLGKGVVESPLLGPLVAVSFVSLLAGNLLATDRWKTLVGFAAAGVASAHMEARKGFIAVLCGLTAVFGSTILEGSASFTWAVTEAGVVLVSLALVLLIDQCTAEDPRGYALLRVDTDVKAVTIQNDCCMDIKLLVFSGTDIIRLVPNGGLLGGVLVKRGERHTLGCQSRYKVKIYAPFERELGSYDVRHGHYILKATAPPLLPVSSDGAPPMFRNSSEEHVVICCCPSSCWTCSLWVPFAPILARLVVGRPSLRVGPQESTEIPTPCLLRVYRDGRFGALFHQTSGMLREGESADFLGRLRWTMTSKRVRKTCSSSLISALQ